MLNNETLNKMNYADLYHAFTIVRSYEDYTTKIDWLINTYPKQFDSNSMFEERLEEYKYFCYSVFRYFKTKKECEHFNTLYKNIKRVYKDKMKTDASFFRQALKYELWNYEVSISYDYDEALHELGYTYNSLSDWQRKILDEETQKLWY